MISERFKGVPSWAYLGLAIVIFAGSSSVTRKLIDLGKQNLSDGRNPISLCNVLFIGNLCALSVMVPLFHRQWNRRNLSSLGRKDWLAMGCTAVLGTALAPSLFFMALNYTRVTNVVLMSRLETPITLLLGTIFLGARVNAWTAIGSLLSFGGVGLTAFLAHSGTPVPMPGTSCEVGRGELMAAIAAIMLSISTIISQSRLQRIPVGIFSIFRTALGTAIFFTVALYLFGREHFAEAFSPFLWRWMFFYGAIIVVGGQLCWFNALKRSTSTEVAIASAFSPIAAIAIAFLLLKEVPTSSQLFGGGLILLGIVLSLMGNLRQAAIAPDLEGL